MGVCVRKLIGGSALPIDALPGVILETSLPARSATRRSNRAPSAGYDPVRGHGFGRGRSAAGGLRFGG